MILAETGNHETGDAANETIANSTPHNQDDRGGRVEVFGRLGGGGGSVLHQTRCLGACPKWKAKSQQLHSWGGMPYAGLDDCPWV